MAGSRLEKFGTIFHRLQGLLRSGAMKDVDKPIWYDIYERFPPKVKPNYMRELPRQEVRTILYPEDVIRAKFYECYNTNEVVDLESDKKAISQLFVEKYFSLLKVGVPQRELFDRTYQDLKDLGVKIYSINEPKEKLTAAKTSVKPTEKPSITNAALSELFGEVPKELDLEEFDMEWIDMTYDEEDQD